MSQLASTEGPAASQRGAAEGARIGHVHLRVSDLERSVQFYCRALGFHVTQYRGTRAALLSAGGYHHHVALNTRESLGGSQAPHGCTGLDHFAIVYPSHESFADAVRRVQAAGINFDRASDHGVSESIYIHDPDGIAIELSWDRPPERWPRNEAGELAASDCPLDVGSLLSPDP
jgi:catechol 2,3-dioxygenase